MLTILLLGISAAYGLAGQLPALELMAALLMLGMACLGMGNGAVFQLVPQRFQKQIGIATGVIGAVGGIGGFFLPNVLGIFKQGTGSFSMGFLVLSGVALAALVLLRMLVAIRQGWRISWRTPQTADASIDDARAASKSLTEGFGEASPPQIPLMWASCGGLPPQLAHKERILEGLRPSKPPATRATA